MAVEVILLEKIERLGNLGDVVRVAPGYARNFLLPMGKALRANDENKKTFEAEKKKYEAANEAKRSDSEKLAKKVDGLEIKIVRAASETGQLYGSVNARDIAEALQEKKHKVERASILIGKAIKEVGEYEIKLRFHADVAATIKLQVVKNAEDVILPTVTDAEIAEEKSTKKKSVTRSKEVEDEADEEAAEEKPAKKAAAKKPAAKKKK